MADPQLQFGEFRFIPGTGELTRRGEAIPLEHQPALVLATLLAAGGRLVSRRELADAIWTDGTHVNFDDGLNYCVRQIRAALGDDPKAPRFIETVPRRGYRFIAAVAASAATSPFMSRRRAAAAAVAVAVFALALVIESRPNNHHEMAVSLARAVHDLIF
jgi:DNA-binding winged helix-turn-helix (wHTH) protein